MSQAINRWNQLNPNQTNYFVNFLPPFGGVDESKLKKAQASVTAKFK
jgi:hypothetical protein